MAKKKKSALPKKQRSPKKQLFVTRFSYVAITAFLFILCFVAVSPIGFSSSPSVLGASTTTSEQGGFSFGNFFSSIFSFFSGHTNSGGQSFWNSLLTTKNTSSQTTTHTTQVTVTQDELAQLATDAYDNGTLPLGDNNYTTSGPKKGYIYLCSVPESNEGGAQESGSWLSRTVWTTTDKPTVLGSVFWSNAQFSDTVSDNTRTLSGNGLPVGMTTGVFPIASSDPAYQYDQNPNTIQAQTLHLQLPINPTYSDTPNCMGMEVGVMTNGVPLFNGFDAELRDAPAHEIQDSCDGHPQSGGEYHYHSLSRCFNDPSVQTVIGFALDGFPITGGKVSNGEYLTTDSLDECHGITSQITLDGKQVTMYHYVMTQDFPYSVSCFRGKPVSLQVIASTKGGQGKNGQGMMQSNQQGQGMPGTKQGMQQSGVQGGQGSQQQSGMGSMGSAPTPPQAALTACSGKTSGTSCSFTGQNGSTVTGTCKTPPHQTSGSLACVPANPPMMEQGMQSGTSGQGAQQNGQMTR